ncbi:MAG TPA: hypothetical protein VKM94_17960 [Blastocatellia bacterium]|nr:hypothetical protein [Blastocatellia bacterium]
MTEQAGSYYRHSGRFPTGGLVVAIAGGGAVGAFLALIYAYFDALDPFIYFNMMASVILGAASGWFTGLLLARQRVRNNLIAAFAGGLVGLIALYVAWAAWPDAVLGDRSGMNMKFLHLLTSPAALLQSVGWINKNGAWRIGYSVQTGFVLWVAWVGEAVIVIGFSMYVARIFVRDRVFCEACQHWCEKEKNVLEAHGWGTEELSSRLEAKDFDYLATLGPRTRNDVEWIRLDLDRCKNCGETTTLTAKRVDLTREKGRELPQPIIKDLLLSPSEVERLRSYNFDTSQSRSA